MLGKTAASLALAMCVPFSQGPGSQYTPDLVVGETQIVSPTVVATWARTGTRLDGAVLWRGRRGWFADSRGRHESGGGKGGAIHSEIVYGGLRLNMDIKDGRVAVGLDGAAVGRPTADNIVLVDHVDEGRGQWTIESLSIPPDLPTADVRLHDVLRMSPRLVAFLQCDIRSADAREQAAFDRLCAQVVAR
jgi:hypothetical protein